ncbi:hypothetical protein PHYBOEH_010410 [Phytophthora boehmeriae]|uniref:M96 mating-specific protein family n=1 Tax=Phytophthora boehmeriae TaxID=109152 RepID=A0A8T1VMQ1_9STRA|nr:hypothetical protein PHYBOEH_010410 [Phytophthora boehmeriae]
MNFLEPDDMATVAEALAFIDSCDSEAFSSASGSDSGGSPLPPDKRVPSSSNVPRSETVDDSFSSKPKRKRRSKSPAGYSTQLLHRKKAEMQELREQAKELEMKVEQLKRSRAVGVPAIAAHSKQLNRQADVKWMELATLEFRRRQQAEKLNRRLKKILQRQFKVDNALKAVVMKGSVLEDVDFVFGKTPTFQDSLAVVDNSEAIMAQLEKKVSEMYLESNDLFDSGMEMPSISCQMKQRFDRYLGKTIEISTSAPLACSMEIASEALWKELTTIRTYPDKSYRYMQTDKPNSMQKNFDQTFQGGDGGVPVNGLQFMRKFEEANRIVLARAYKMLLPTEGIHMGCNAWTVISRSELDPQGASDVRFFLQLFMEGEEGFSARIEDVAYLRDLAFETWSSKMRNHAQFLQEILIETGAGMSEATMKRLRAGMC